MIERKTKINSIKPSERVYKALMRAVFEDKQQGVASSYADVLDRWMDAAKLAGGAAHSQLAPIAKARQGYPYPETREWHEKLERVLTEGTKRNRIGIEENLDWAVGNLGKSADEELLIGKRTVNEKR